MTHFPIAAIAGANDITISIKFRNLNELVMNVPNYYISGTQERTGRE